jgi:hypothetical protein
MSRNLVSMLLSDILNTSFITKTETLILCIGRMNFVATFSVVRYGLSFSKNVLCKFKLLGHIKTKKRDMSGFSFPQVGLVYKVHGLSAAN